MKRATNKTVKNLSATVFILLLMFSCNNSTEKGEGQTKSENPTTILNQLNGKWDKIESIVQAQYAHIDMSTVPPLYSFKLENDSTINVDRNSIAGFKNFKIRIDSIKKDTIYTDYEDFVFKKDTLYMINYKNKSFTPLLKRK